MYMGGEHRYLNRSEQPFAPEWLPGVAIVHPENYVFNQRNYQFRLNH